MLRQDFCLQKTGLLTLKVLSFFEVSYVFVLQLLISYVINQANIAAIDCNTAYGIIGIRPVFD